jgi:hypothetical protein
MPQLNDTQLLVLSAASQRADGLLTPPERLRGAAVQFFGAKLIQLQLVTECAVGPHDPIWRQSDEKGRTGLQVSAKGLAAIGVEADGSTAEPELAAESPSATAAPRSGSKIAVVLELLQRPAGASIDEIQAATRWLPHTIRAALTGLRKRGHAVELRCSEGDRAAYHAGVMS